MPAIAIHDEEKYGKALGILIRRGGTFRTRPTRVLVINPVQLRALEEAGLVKKSNHPKASEPCRRNYDR
jgi:hypothetical protein